MNLAFDRLRRTTGAEVAWRTRAAARTSAQRASARLREPQWSRDDIAHILSDAVLDEAAQAALAQKNWAALHDALAATLRGRTARFALDPASARVLRLEVESRWPGAAAAARERADRLLAGRFDLLGYRGLEFTGDLATREIDWHLDPVHNRRAPRAFWADVPYLDPAIGDHKIIWELNRQQHWLQLGRALWLTRDPRYSRAILRDLESWLAANPPLIGINWASMLEVGFRTMSWTWAMHFLLGDVGHEEREAGPWLVDLLVGLDRQMAHLEQNLSYYFSPNTHLTGEALALYVVGAALPELRGSSDWLDTGRRILLTEIDRQIGADGGHAERSTHYQRYTLDFYLLALLSAERIGDGEAASRFADAAGRLAEFTRTIADDTGRLPLIGDDDGGMLWPIGGRDCNDVRDSLGLAAVVLHRPDLAPWGVPEEAFWVGGRHAIDRAPLIEAQCRDLPIPPSRTLLETGCVVLRDGGGGHAVFDAGAHGYLNGGHAHADALALAVTLGNRRFLIDTGTSTYTMDARLRDRMRSSMSHNTVTIDDRSAASPAGPFHWRTRADARLHASRHNPGFDWSEGVHDGYVPLRHRRAVVRTAGSGWLVVDEITGGGHHSAAAYWHFDPEWMLTCDAPGRLRATHMAGDAAWLLHDGGDVWLTHADDESGLGWCAPTYGTLIPTWTARVTRRATTPFAMVTWIDRASDSPELTPSLERIHAACEPGGRAVGVRIASSDRASFFMLRFNEAVVRDARAAGIEQYQTDARVLHYTEEAGRLLVLDVADATHAVARRDGLASVSASHQMPDLHVACVGGVLDLWTSRPPAELRIDADALHHVHGARANGRELRRHGDSLGAVHVAGGDWGDSSPAAAPIPDCRASALLA